MNGTKVDFPTILSGKPGICIFGFSKDAGDRTKDWMKSFIQDGINAWSVANLEGAPALVRAMIRSSMRKGTSSTLQQHSLIMTKDLKGWKRAAGVHDDRLPVVVVFDSAGNMDWTYEGTFNDEAFRAAKARLLLRR